MRCWPALILPFAACSGDTTSPPAPAEVAPPAVPPPAAEDARAALAGLSYSTRTTTDPEAGDAPMTTLVITASNGSSWDVGPFYGECSPKADTAAAYALGCWWAGAGSTVEVRSSGGKAEVWKQDLDEAVQSPLPFEKVWAQPSP